MQAQVAYTYIIGQAATLRYTSVSPAFDLSPAHQACKVSLSMTALFQVYERAKEEQEEDCQVPGAIS